MKKEQNDIIVDMSSLKIHGEVLDLGFESKGIIFRALKDKSVDFEELAVTRESSLKHESSDEYSWVCGYPTELPFDDGSFSTVTVFFSIPLIGRKYMRNKAIKEMARVLKKGGELHVWDINLKPVHIKTRTKMKVKLPGDEVIDFQIEHPGHFGSNNIDGISPVIERYFSIVEKCNSENYFYIKAEKKT